MNEARVLILANVEAAVKTHDPSLLDQAAGMTAITYSLGVISKEDLIELDQEIMKNRIFCKERDHDADSDEFEYTFTRRAAENLETYVSEEEALAIRKQFVRNLGWLLSQTRDGVLSCELEVPAKGVEYVVIKYLNGSEKRVNVSLDSYAAIIRDVAAHFQ